MKQATITSSGRLLLLQPTAKSGNDFEGVREACRAAGSRYDGQLKREVIPVRQIVELVRQSTAHGLQLLPTPSAADGVRREAKRLRDEAGFLERREGDSPLFNFQAEGVGYLWQNPHALLFDEMGLGKTVQALMAVEDNAAVLVICPATLKGEWLREAKRWRPDLDSQVLDEFRWPEAGELVIINYARLKDKLKTHPWPKTVTILDEAHYIKNGKSLRTRRARVVCRRTQKRNGLVWLLTGTPLMNKPQELWSMFVALNIHKGAFGNFTNFAKLFGGTRDEFGWEFSSEDVTEEAVSIIRSLCLRRERLQVLPDLPSKIYKTWEVPPPDDGELVRQIDGIDMDLLELALDDGQEVQLQDVALLVQSRAALARHKAEQAMPLIHEYEIAGEPIVVFSMHRWAVEELEKRSGWKAIHGDVPMEDRTQAVADFQAGKLKGLALTIQAGGVGLTLTRACQAIFIDLAWVPAHNLQAEDRVCRIGQDRGVIITQVQCAHPVDAAVMGALRTKAAMVAATTGRLAEKPRPRLEHAALSEELLQIAEMMGL